MGVEGHAAQTYTPHGTKTMPAPSTRVIDRAL